MCLKPFSWAKNKRKLFSVGKTRGPLLARAALSCMQRQRHEASARTEKNFFRCYDSKVEAKAGF